MLSGNPALALPALFAGGVLTSLTPCVYPMIPITAAIVGGQTAGDRTGSKLRPVLLTFTYVLGLALVYSALGVFAGLTGTLFGSVSTNPWLYFAMANVLILAGTGDAGRDTDSASGGYHAARGNDGDGGAVLRRVRDGGDVRPGRRALLRPGDGGGADLGDGDEERRARLPLSADVLAGDVDAAGRRRAFERLAGAITARWCVDGDGEEGLRARDVRRRRNTT